jgi:hypothetical protein
MSTSAILLMLFVKVSVIFITTYFFIRVIKTPDKPEPDSYLDNNP